MRKRRNMLWAVVGVALLSMTAAGSLAVAKDDPAKSDARDQMPSFLTGSTLFSASTTTDRHESVKTDPVKVDPKDQMPVVVAAIVDMQRVLQESRAAKSVQKQLDGQRAKYQADTEKEENQLRNAEQELTRAHEHLSNDVYTDREQQLRQRFLSVERHVSSRRHNLDQAYTAAMNEVKNALLEIVQATARAHGANMVIVKQQVFWSEKPLDITDEVLQKLDKKLPQVSVNLSADAP